MQEIWGFEKNVLTLFQHFIFGLIIIPIFQIASNTSHSCPYFKV